MNELGIVVIGRNEGPRLAECLRSLAAASRPTVYVDSGSSDGSVALARAAGATVVELSAERPFTAARARNEGFRALVSRFPQARWVQFVDGDCTVEPGWLDAGVAALAGAEDRAIVCGRRRELYRGASKGNLLCDLEWNTPVGEAEACGGDFVARRDAFERVGGFTETMIAGEEPDLSLRLRGAGWKILRLDRAMTVHDARMTSFAQWWRRSTRAGHAFAELAWRHGAASGSQGYARVRSVALHVGLAGVALAAAVPSRGVSVALALAAFALSWSRIVRSAAGRGAPNELRLYAAAVVLGKFAQAVGMLRFARTRLVGGQTPLIEYKQPPVA